MARRVLFVFLDGVGIGVPDARENPFLEARLPTFRGLLGGEIPTLEHPRIEGDGGVAFPLDATLGMEGLPQSGTGQTALLTGRNAAALFGRHFGPWVPVRLRPLLEEENLLSRALRSGSRVVFANAYPENFFDSPDSRFLACPPLAARAAGLLNRHARHLARGEAVASDIVNTGWRTGLGHREVPEITPREAGLHLARIARRADLTFFAHYGTDSAGHRGGMEDAIAAMERVDGFLAGILEELPDDLVLLLASDHGNVEEVSAGHTRNPALGIIVGDRASHRSLSLRSLTDVAGAVLSWIE